jgi:hypothetical protein
MTLKNTRKIGGEVPTDEEIKSIWSFIYKFFVYIIFLVLYGVVFMNITFWSNFIVFILLFCLHTVCGLYIFKDMFTTKEFMNRVSDPSKFAVRTNNGTILMAFIVVFVIAFIFKIVSLAMIIAVFDYARYQTPSNNYSTYDMSQRYRDLINHYKSSYKRSTMLFLLFAYLIYAPTLPEETQIAVRNCLCIVISIILLGLTIYEIIKSNEFLQVKQRKANLYVAIPKDTDVTQT